MTIKWDTIPSWVLPIVITIFALYFFYIVWPWPQICLYFFRLRFFKAIIRVTAINDSANQDAKLKGYTWDQLNSLSWDELKLDFKKLIEKNPRFKNSYKNASELFEEFLFNMDTKGASDLDTMTSLKTSINTRAKVLVLIRLARNENPFLGLPSKEANLLSLINQALVEKNVELGKSSLIQLSQEIEQMATIMESQTKRNIISYIVSIVGVILTIIFGLISLKSLF